MRNKTLTLWNMPLECVPHILSSLRGLCSETILDCDTQLASSIINSIADIENDFKREMEKINKELEEIEIENEEEI